MQVAPGRENASDCATLQQMTGMAYKTRARMLLHPMSGTIQDEILENLDSAGSLTYAELRSRTRFKSRADSGKFAFHLRRLLRESLVNLDPSGTRYRISHPGRAEPEAGS